MTHDRLTQIRIENIRQYFMRLDARESTVLNLFTDDFEFFFPKFGEAKGKEGFARFGARMTFTKSLVHDIDGFTYIVDGDTIAVEGRERGESSSGIIWPDGKVSQGRFCNVFKFDGELIRYLAIYVDPDFASEDTDRVRLIHG